MKLLAQHTIFVAIVSYTLIFERRMFSDDPTYHTFTMDFYGTLKGWTKEKKSNTTFINWATADSTPTAAGFLCVSRSTRSAKKACCDLLLGLHEILTNGLSVKLWRVHAQASLSNAKSSHNKNVPSIDRMGFFSF